jgi:subtilase family protein
MMDDLKNSLLIGLTVLTLAVGAWWLNPRPSLAQQAGVGDRGGAGNQPSAATSPATQTKPAVRPVPKPPSLHYLTGILDARARLGKQVPTGRGITLGHVEVGPGQYMPNIKEPRFKAVTFVKRSGASKVSGHATSTARVIYGINGLAPGVSVVHCYDSRDWMTEGYLNAGSTTPPIVGPIRVFTHSWVSDSPGAADVLRRTDWLIDTQDTLVVVGVNNGANTPVPYLLATAYNVIAVGTAQRGGSSGGYTRIETPGRCKPDIVGPRGLTSFTTPAVAAIAARLLQAADEMTQHAHRAGKAELIKAVLLTGAVKPDGWQPQPGKPLDEHLGAGVVNFDHSLQVLQAGPADPGRLPKRMGWDFRQIDPNQTRAYSFQLAADMGETSITLVWNRRVASLSLGAAEDEAGGTSGGTTGVGGWLGLPRTADLNLRLVYIDDAGDERDLAVSNSRIDNVEHLYLKTLSPGRYRLEVTRRAGTYDEPWDYALAWRVELAGIDNP